MKVHVFDTYVTIKDREGHPDMDDTLLEKLDEMLTTYGVPHAFTLPHEKTIRNIALQTTSKPFPRLSFPGRSQNAVASQRFQSGSETGKPVYL